MTNQMYVTEIICRACLEPIFEKCYPLTGQLVFDVDLDISSMIEFCTSSKLNLSEDLPDKVCLPCFKTIRICYRFLKTFYEAQTKLNTSRENLPVKVNIQNPCIIVDAKGSKQYFSPLNIAHSEAAIKNNAEVAECSAYENGAENESNAEGDEILYENDPIDSINEYEVPYSSVKSEVEENINENEAECSLNENEAEDSLNEFESEDVKLEGVKSESVVYDQDGSSDNQYYCETYQGETLAVDETAINNPKIEVVFERNSQVDAQLYYFICPVCGEKFSKTRVFYTHVANHNLHNIKCNRCPGQPELALFEYIEHYVNHHKYHCDICNKVLTTDFGFRYHMKLHATSEKVKCPVKGCRRMFLTVMMLKSHMKVHYTSKTYPCHLCESTFYNKDNLTYHLKKHSGKRDYLCSICGQAFYQSVTLRDHMYRHTGYRRYVCEVCGKGFISTGGLKKHERYCSRKSVSYIEQAKNIQVQMLSE